MKFSTLEKIMYENGARNLAEIARKLKTTPQAVSNWKARGQVPFHVVAEINKYTFKKQIKLLLTTVVPTKTVVKL